MTDGADELKLLREDVQRKTFAVQSLIGQRARLKALMEITGRMTTAKNAADIKDLLLFVNETKSQFMQEAFALALAGGKRAGFFVEFGACDGAHLSNTSMLEKHFGWRGILSEPAKVWHETLQASRSARIELRCVSGKTGDVVEFSEGKEPGQSSLRDLKTRAERRYQVETVSLLDLLREHKAPRFIDFLSMDTEGTEPDILKAFDFDKYKFGFISVEQHKDGDEITSLLMQAGYEVLFPREAGLSRWSTITGFDVWYVPADTLANKGKGSRSESARRT